MALRATAPEAEEKRLKCMFFGPAGSAKTTTAIQFPKPYLIDTERGAENDQYVKLLKEAGGVVFNTFDVDDMIEEVKSLLSEKHDFQTLIIDPITIVYEEALNTAADDPAIGTSFGKHTAVAKRKMSHLFNLLMRLDMNVIVTSHAKKDYGDDSKEKGITFDGWQKLPYVFDLVLESQIRGQQRIAVVTKSRIETFPTGESFPFAYDEIANRYGKAHLERGSEPIKLATKKQADTLAALFGRADVSAEKQAKWLKKHGAENLLEVPASTVEEAIKFYTAKLKKQSELDSMKGAA